MLSNDDVQAALVAFLKSKSTITSFLSSSGQIKEDQWQGTDFVYPAVRVALGTQTPVLGECPAYINFSVLCFSELPSSKQADDIAGQVNSELHQHNFSQSGVRFAFIASTGLIAAIRTDRNTWRSEATFRAMIQSA